jgi:hypothetical protein
VSVCAECMLARDRVWHGLYANWCDGCMARAIARSHAAFDALHERGKKDVRGLREIVARCMPEVPFEDARRLVWEWWQLDHAKEVEAV